MTAKTAYSYTILRYVHDVVAGEVLNVGVVMHAPDADFLEVRTRKRIGRLKSAFPDLDRDGFQEAMRAIDRGLAAVADQIKGGGLFKECQDARVHAVKVLPDDDSALQWSPVSVGRTLDLDKTLERLYQRYVEQYVLKVDARRTDEDIWRPIQKKLEAQDVDIPFTSKVLESKQDQIEFKKAWKNGSWHAYEAISFDLTDADHIKDKARRWRGHLSAVADGMEEEDIIKLHFILGRPDNVSLMGAYKTASALLKGAEFSPEIVDEDDVGEFVSTLAQEYRNHQG